MTPEITIIVPKKLDKYNYKELEGLFKMRHVMSTTLLEQEVKGTNANLFLNLGEDKSIPGCNSQYCDNGVQIGFYQSQAWISCSSLGGIVFIDDFLKEYEMLAKDFGDRFKQMYRDFVGNNLNIVWRFFFNKYSPITWLLGKIGKEDFQNTRDAVEYLSSSRIVSEEYIYRFAALKFVHDFLDDFLKENGIVDDNGKWVYLDSNKV